jgi:hypothetical protein
MRRALAATVVLCSCLNPQLMSTEETVDASVPPPIRKVYFVMELGPRTSELQAAVSRLATTFAQGASDSRPTFSAEFTGTFYLPDPDRTTELTALSNTFAAPDVFAATVVTPALDLDAQAASPRFELPKQQISNDLAHSPERTQYRVVVLTRSGDTDCAGGTAMAACAAWLQNGTPDLAGCSACQLDSEARDLRGLLELQEAHRLLIQPVWVHSSSDDDGGQRLALEALAREGGTKLVETDVSMLDSALQSLDYGPTH